MDIYIFFVQVILFLLMAILLIVFCVASIEMLSVSIFNAPAKEVFLYYRKGMLKKYLKCKKLKRGDKVYVLKNKTYHELEVSYNYRSLNSVGFKNLQFHNQKSFDYLVFIFDEKYENLIFKDELPEAYKILYVKD